MVRKMFITHFNLSGDLVNATETAKFLNKVQERALQTRFGIPVIIFSDPRHNFIENFGTGFRAGAFSEWSESLGFAAIRDPNLVRKFAEIAREKYLAVGIRAALHPQVDLATEPRWARLGNIWGENATFISEFLVEYIKGFQGEEIGPRNIITVTKYFPGGGPMENGEDLHFTYGKNQIYPGNNFNYHFIFFKAVIVTGASEERIDVSVRRFIREKFLFGLFDNLFIDAEAAAKLVGTEKYLRVGKDAQRRVYNLLTNKKKIFPFKNVNAATKFYIEGFNAIFFETRKFTVVKTPQEADLAFFRLQAFYEPRPGGFKAIYHAGSFEFNATEKARQAVIYSAVPTVVDVILDRPAAIPEIFKGAAAVFGSFGNGSEAFLDIIFGQVSPEGRLPFNLPRSQKAVEASREDVPYDIKNPVFRFGDGLRYTQ
ncbi:hypothetical protein MCOR33_007589 [Pyricularia grisea]|uniref:beta-glucosidase n=1 Tax=Pyricularia grisea TaxID=148305 RepID=A0ABQ8NE37_PYRGI|nr:hypothetical protein MCOR33_007589 [Pyricularia grisea]